MPKIDRLTKAEMALRKYALGFPTATEDFPWGERAIKIKGKVFCFLSRHDGNLNVTVKLPESHTMALTLPFATPTGYGMGKHGWVTNRFGPDMDVPVEMLKEWIDECFRAVAPKKFLAEMDAAKNAKKPFTPKKS